MVGVPLCNTAHKGEHQVAITRDQAIRLLEAKVTEYVEAAEDDDPGYWDRFATDQQVINDYAMYVYFGQNDISGHVATPLILARDWVKLAIREGTTFESGRAAVYAFLKYISYGEGREFMAGATHETFHEGRDVGLSGAVHYMLQDEGVCDRYMKLWMACKDKPLLQAASMALEGWMGDGGLQEEVHVVVERWTYLHFKRVSLLVDLRGNPDQPMPESDKVLATELGLIPAE